MNEQIYDHEKTTIFIQKDSNECNSEKIKQHNYENYEIEDRTCTAEENRTQVGKRKTKQQHCRPKYTWSLEDCEQSS